jgi:hypothetical protein
MKMNMNLLIKMTLILVLSSSVYSEKNDTITYLQITKGTKIVDRIAIIIYDNKNKDDRNIDITGKICNIDTFEKINTCINKLGRYYNNDWVNIYLLIYNLYLFLKIIRLSYCKTMLL